MSAAAPVPASADPVLYIAGDVHLRSDDGPFLVWLDRLALRHPARLVILGDLFEYWVDTAGAAQRYAGTLAKLRSLRLLGWRVDVIRGNREQVAGRRLAVALGGRMHWPSFDVQLGPRLVRIVHGDRLCHDRGLRAMTAWLSSFWFSAYQACHPEWMQEAVARWIRRCSEAGHRRRAEQAAYTPRGRRPFLDPRRVRGAARGADTLVAGHIHEQWRRQVGGVDLLLVGDWPPSGGHWIEGFADGRLALCPPGPG